MTENLLQTFKNNLVLYKSHIAFCINEHFYTYGELEEQILKIQDGIIESGGSETKRIGIITTNSIQTYASIFASWFLGYAYVPINPKIPAERNLNIIEQADIDLILGSEIGVFEDSIFTKNIRFIHTDYVYKIAELTNILWNNNSDEDRLLYILFTSGSTGLPKGVPISYKNVITFLESYNDLDFRCNENDRFLQMFDLTFDVSVASYLVPLLLGASVYTVPSEGIKYMTVYKLLRDHKITFASLVPSVINYLKPYYQEIKLPELRYCILTAEASNLENVKEWSKCIPGSKIWNLYGPTEATIWCTGYEFAGNNSKSYNGMLAIGKPFSQVSAFIIDDSGNKVEINIKGELCVISNQLSIGYLHDQSRTDAVFIEKEGIRYYRTGDLCYADSEMDIIYCGRIDHQVKVQGFRIELSEIEVLVSDLYKKNNVAVAYKNKNDSTQICLFIEELGFDENAVKKELLERLPYYMIPTLIKSIDKLPINNSGKIDRKSLALIAEK